MQRPACMTTLQSLHTIFACSCGSTTTCMPCSAPRYSTTEWNSGMSSSPSFLSTITLQHNDRSQNAADLGNKKEVDTDDTQIWQIDTSAHHDGLVFQTNRCCCVLGQEKDRHPDAAEEYQVVRITECFAAARLHGAGFMSDNSFCTSNRLPCTAHAISSDKIEICFWGPTSRPVQQSNLGLTSTKRPCCADQSWLSPVTLGYCHLTQMQRFQKLFLQLCLVCMLKLGCPFA